MFTKALIAAFALISTHAIKLESLAEVDSINSGFIASAMGSDDKGGELAQTSDMRLQSIRGSNNRLDELPGGGLAQTSDCYMHMPKGCNNRLNGGGGLAQISDAYMHMPINAPARLNP